MSPPLDPEKRAAWIEKIKAARAKQPAPVPKGSKFTPEHRANMSKAAKASRKHRSKNQNGRLNPMYEGGKWLDKHGYVLLSIDGKGIPEHRHVMECHLGRKLLPHETVHHKNGNRQDNRIENLELWSVSQPKGQRVQEKLSWAREIIALYGDMD
jgi:hypothetical protein